LVFIVIFMAWLSFIPETLQARFLPSIKYSLLSFLFLSLWLHGFRCREYFFKKQDIFIWLYFIVLLAGLRNPLDKGMAIGYYKDLIILGGSVYFLARHTINRSNCRIVLKFLVAFSFIVAFIGILEMIFGKNIIYEKYVDNYYYIRTINQKRMMSTLMNSNILGCYLLACAPLAYYFYSNTKDTVKKGIYLLIFISVVISMLLTFSRGTWIAGLLTLSVYMLLKKRKKMLILIWGGFILFTILVSFLPDGYFKRRFSAPDLVKYVRFEHRTTQYFVTANMLKEHPFVGIGLHNYRKVFDRYSKKELYNEVKIPDSIYLMHLAETGIIGFLGFFMFLFVILRKGILFLKNNNDRKDDRIFLFVFIGFLALLFNMASFDGFLWHTPFYLFWIFAGILVSLSSKGQNETVG